MKSITESRTALNIKYIQYYSQSTNHSSYYTPRSSEEESVIEEEEGGVNWDEMQNKQDYWSTMGISTPSS